MAEQAARPHEGILDDVLRTLVTVAIATVVLVLASCGGGNEVSERERDRAIAAAKQTHEAAVSRGQDLDVGPCIAEQLPGLADWVADIAHDPREDIDDEPENQCRRYRDGEASHFVELTPAGQVIRAD